jgi:hypothetical protein
MVKRSEKIIIACAAALLAQSFLGIRFAHGADTVYRNAQGNLRCATYSTGAGNADETFAIMSQDNSRRLTTGSGDQFVQIRYDDTSHITSKAVWKTTGGQAVRESLEEYFYAPAVTRPARRIRSDFVTKVQEETLYLRNGNVSRTTVYTLPGDEKGAATKNLTGRTDFRYDNQDRVIEEIRMSRTYAPVAPVPAPVAPASPAEKAPAAPAAPGDAATSPSTDGLAATPATPGGTAPADTAPAPAKEPEYVETVEITRYAYTGRSKKPDTELYRNGVLLYKTEYTAERNYTETLFFEGGLSAVVTYENDEKVQERFLVNDAEIKRNI